EAEQDKLDPADTDHRNWVLEMEAEQDGYKAKDKRHGKPGEGEPHHQRSCNKTSTWPIGGLAAQQPLFHACLLRRRRQAQTEVPLEAQTRLGRAASRCK